MFLLAVIAFSIPPAAKVIAIAATVYAILQAVKKAIPQLNGWYSVALNVVLSAIGVVVAVPADQLYTVATLTTLITAVAAAAGIHGTVQNLTESTTPAKN